jgi:hypothetical protein
MQDRALRVSVMMQAHILLVSGAYDDFATRFFTAISLCAIQFHLCDSDCCAQDIELFMSDADKINRLFFPRSCCAHRHALPARVTPRLGSCT